MVHWPEPNRPGFVAFHHDYRDGSHGDPKDEAYFDLPKIEEYMRSILTHPKNYFGIIDQFDKTLQFMVNENGSIRVEIPITYRNGSLTKDTGLDKCVAMVMNSGPSLSELQTSDLIFEAW